MAGRRGYPYSEDRGALFGSSSGSNPYASNVQVRTLVSSCAQVGSRNAPRCGRPRRFKLGQIP
eukprot:scaffold582_cov385-Prasinococcus_capsulatus_cf.AAC.4